jgi:phage terminase Nu1 subunit (DNA packaging protein)
MASSSLGLLGIEEIVVETHTFGTFISTLRASISTLRASWLNWRWTSAVAGLAATEVAAEAAADKLQRHYLEYLLRTEGLPLADAQERATALGAAVTGSEGMS